MIAVPDGPGLGCLVLFALVGLVLGIYELCRFALWLVNHVHIS